MPPTWLTTSLDWLPQATIVLAFLTALIRLTLLTPLLWRRIRRWTRRRHGS
ncbi:hypothetical protein GA0074692_2748 [Micromonospora pallida]|uniref:Uncharacterized protein n=1 Tax=Micromonospora pallida TaxID=145854 RepID=A0A1C6SJ16_9ACTN|nr:hypothetical protein [Micromonospora pallida]SCL29554.1 hypothetical protein GA0074692_2748 [Micromonospora pallida]